MKLFYARNAEAAPKGAKFRNARLYRGPEDKASTVYIDGDYPQIEADYSSRDVVVIRLDAVAPAYAPATVNAEVVQVPADWRDLPFSEPDPRGFSLKGIASEIAGKTVRSKAEAVEVIETYLSGELDRPLPDANGLTRRELNFDLESLGLEIEPDEDPAATLQRIQAAAQARDAAEHGDSEPDAD